MTRFLTIALIVWLATLMAFMLAACTTTPKPEPRIVQHEVSVPVLVKCSADPGPEPAYPDTPEALRAAPDIFEQVKLLLVGRALRIARLIDVEAANAGCR